MNLVDVYTIKINTVRAEVKDECKACIEEYGKKLHFVDMGLKIFCILDKGYNEFDIRKVENCLDAYKEDDENYILVLRHLLNNIGVFNPMDY